MMMALLQRLPQASVPALPNIDWGEVFQWESLVQGLVRVGVIVVLAFLTYRLLKLLTARLQREVVEEDPVVKRRREQRAQTLASLLNSIGLVLIVVVVTLMILSTFIDIAPLLATAGIAGLAVSFGAQSLVKDVISGAFILMEGQFGVGDVVRAGGTAGFVEKITLRTTVLRDIHGIVHVIPNGEITTLSNLTKSWSRALLEIGVAYKEDVDRVMEVMTELGKELYDDPEWGPLLLEEPVVPGIESFGDSGVVIRIMVKTLPLKQWDVQRELRRRIKKRFDAEGIEIPFPHRTFYWGKDQVPQALRDGAALAAGRSRATKQRGRGAGAKAGRRTAGDGESAPGDAARDPSPEKKSTDEKT